jgi:hypothetical protein
MSDTKFLKRLGWRLPEDLLQATLLEWPTSDHLPLEAIPKAFAACAYGASLRAAGFTYFHEDTIESVRFGGIQVLKDDRNVMLLSEMEPDNDRLYAYISACNRMLQCALDFSNAADILSRRTWLVSFLETNKGLNEELDTIRSYYDRTHFGPSLRADETLLIWNKLISGNVDDESDSS